MSQKTKSIYTLSVKLQNGDTMESTYTDLQDIPELNKSDLLAHVFSGMTNNSRLSVGQLWNEGCYVTFKIYVVTIFNRERNTIMKGHQDLDTGVWHVNLRPKDQHTEIAEAKHVYELYNNGALVI